MSKQNWCFHEDLYDVTKMTEYIRTLTAGCVQTKYAEQVGLSQEYFCRLVNGKVPSKSVGLLTLYNIYNNSSRKNLVNLEKYLKSGGYILDEVKDYLFKEHFLDLVIDDCIPCIEFKPSASEKIKIQKMLPKRVGFSEICEIAYSEGYSKAITDITKEMLLNRICNPNITVSEAFEKYFQSLSYEQKGEVMEEYLKKKSEKESEDIEIEEELER